jgi:hypothetical protein
MRITRRKEQEEMFGKGSVVADPELRDGLDLIVRYVDGLEVTLYWSRASGRTWVEAVNRETGERLLFDTAPAKALDVFYDSFRYFFSDAA